MHTDNLFIKDNQLIRSLANGDSKVFQEVYKSSYQIVTRSLQNMNAQQSEAEDVYHAALLVLFEKSKEPEFVLSCSISTFLVAVARKKWLKTLEQEKRLTEKEIAYARLHADETAEAYFDVHKIQAQEEQQKKLNAALEELGSPCREIVESFYINSKSMQEIADEFNYSNPDTAKTQKHKCLKRLKKIFLTQ